METELRELIIKYKTVDNSNKILAFDIEKCLNDFLYKIKTINCMNCDYLKITETKDKQVGFRCEFSNRQIFIDANKFKDKLPPDWCVYKKRDEN